MVELSIRISNLTDPDEIEPLARELARLKGVNVGERPRDIHPSNLVDWAKSEARWILRQYPGYYLHIQDGWAEETYKKMAVKDGS